MIVLQYLYSRVSGRLLSSTGEPVLVHPLLRRDGVTVYLCLGSVQAALPIICQLVSASPKVQAISMLVFCHLTNIYPIEGLHNLWSDRTTALTLLLNPSMKTL